MAEQDYSRAMETYKQLKEIGLEGEAKSFMDGIEQKYPKGTSARPEEIQQGLERILKEHQEKMPVAFTGPSKKQCALGLGVLALIVLASTGMPYAPLY